MAFMMPAFSCRRALGALLLFVGLASCASAGGGEAAREAMPWVRVNAAGDGFVLGDDMETPLVLWGVNYDHDSTPAGRLIEDYWLEDWQRVEQDIREISALGFNTVRIHLQTARFVNEDGSANQENLEQLLRLVRLAQEQGLYLLLTGLGFYHAQDTPQWILAMDEQQRWELHARFWEIIAGACREQPAVFAYDLMNEPVVPGRGNTREQDWLLGELAGKHFAQRLALDADGRNTLDIAAQWIEKMTQRIRKVDDRHLITLGIIPWPAGKPIFYDPQVAAGLDFTSIHLYPRPEKRADGKQILQKYQVGKPLVVTEIFPIHASPKSVTDFIRDHADMTAGWYSFYWGTTVEEYRQALRAQDTTDSDTVVSALMLQWLSLFSALRLQSQQ
jgi:hypothetical protein